MRRMTLVLFSVAAIGLLSSQAATAAEGPRTPLTWHDAAEAKRLEARLTKEDVTALVDQLSGDRYLVPVTVDSFRFIDTDADGVPELIASVDYSGRGFYGRLFIIKGTGTPRYEVIDAWDTRGVANRVLDLNGDGRPEIVVTKLMSPYGGGYPQATYSAVYSRQSAGWREASALGWYKDHELPRIEEQLRSIRLIPNPAEFDQARADATEMERDKVLRIIGSDREAGLATATAWAADARPYRRIYAAVVLADIRTPVARARLTDLTSDPDRRVSEAARVGLQRAREPGK